MNIYILINDNDLTKLTERSVRQMTSYHKTVRRGLTTIRSLDVRVPPKTGNWLQKTIAVGIQKYIYVEKAVSLATGLTQQVEVREYMTRVLMFSGNRKITLREYPFLGWFVETAPDNRFVQETLRTIGVSYDPRLTKSLAFYYKIASQANWRPINTFFDYRRVDDSIFLRRLWNWFHHGVFYENMFMFVNFEVNSHCNRTCVYCPNKFFQRPIAALRFDTFKKTIDELGALHYRGFIHYAFYGEPLLDNRLKDFLRYAKKVCPEGKNHINTNGDLLTVDRYKSLTEAGADFIFVTLHDGVLSEKRKQFFIKAKEVNGNIDFALPSQMVFNNRAGLVKVGTDRIAQSPCPLPSYDVEITCAGYVLPCCNDYFEKMRMGNIIDDSLMSIWRNKKFVSFRNDLKKGFRAKYDICKHCNMRVPYNSIGESRVRV